MCLGIPGKVVEVYPDQLRAMVEIYGLKRSVITQLVGEVMPGDYLIVHAGYAIEKVDLADAQQRIRLWEELLSAE